LIALQMEIKVGNNAYLSSAVGNVRSHVLPSGDVLWHGPISGSITIDDEEFKITAGFSKLESTGEVMIIITIQSGYEMIAFSFGNDIIHGEVLEFFSEKVSASQQYDQQPGLSVDQDLSVSAINSQNNESSLLSFPDLTVTPGIFDGDGGGGGGYPSLGPNKEWKYKGIAYKTHTGTAYDAVETRIYYDETSSNLIVTIKPYISDTEDFASTLGTVNATLLNSITVEVEMTQYSGTMYANIDGYSIPHRDEYTVSFLGFETVYLYAFVRDYLAYCSVPSNVLSALQSSIHGDIEVEPDMHHTTIDIDLSFLSSMDINLLEDIYPGLPFLFNLERGNPDSYTGDTPYIVRCTVEYCIMLGSIDSTMPAVFPFYYSETAEYRGTIDVVG